MRKQSGFSAIEIVVAVVMVAIIGFLGFSFYTNSQKSKQAATDQTSQTISTETINNTEDLDAAARTMDDMNIEEESEESLTELDKELAEF